MPCTCGVQRPAEMWHFIPVGSSITQVPESPLYALLQLPLLLVESYNQCITPHWLLWHFLRKPITGWSCCCNEELHEAWKPHPGREECIESWLIFSIEVEDYSRLFYLWVHYSWFLFPLLDQKFSESYICYRWNENWLAEYEDSLTLAFAQTGLL